MASRYTIRIDQGSTWRIYNYWREPLRDLTTGDLILDDDGNVQPGPPISLEGVIGRMHIRRALTDTTPMLELTSANGGVVITQPVVRMLDYVMVASTTDLVLSGLQTIDGVLLVAGDRVLAGGQTDAATGGVYVAASGAWSRASDADTYQDLDVGACVWVRSGARYGDATFRQTATLTSLTDPQTWAEDASIGRFELLATDEQTDLLTSSGVYDVELETTGGEVTRVLEGKVRLSRQVTREE